MELLQVQLADLKEKLSEVENERDGFPNYGALISFYNFIDPVLAKMQYWKGEKLSKESQPYQTDDNRNKPGPSRNCHSWMNFCSYL